MTTTESNVDLYERKLAGIDRRIAELREEHARESEPRRLTRIEEQIVRLTHARRDVEIQLRALTERSPR